MADAIEIVSPIPGTFYARETPTSDPYIAIGQQVAAGETIGLVEVMKMFNPVTAPAAGTVTEILVENSDIVDAGQLLVKLEATE